MRATIVLLTVLATATLTTTGAQAGCFHKKGDPSETLTETDGGFIWRHKGKTVQFEAGSGGTGVEYRIAYDPKMNGFRYSYSGNLLIFGGVTYVAGCRAEK